MKSLKWKLRRLSAEMHNGRGFFLLRAFPVDDFHGPDCVVAHAGVSAYTSSLRELQDPIVSVLSRATDLSQTHTVGTPAYTNEKQVFHSDNGELSLHWHLERRLSPRPGVLYDVTDQVSRRH